MNSLKINLHDVLAVAQLIELENTSEPKEEKLKRLFSFLPNPVSVEIKEKTATITFGETKADTHSQIKEIITHGKTCLDSGNYSEAFGCFKTALEVNPLDSESRKNIGFTYFDVDDHLNFQKSMIEALLINPKYSEIWMILSKYILTTLRDKDTSQKYLEIALTLCPQDLQLLMYAGLQDAEYGRHEDSFEHFRRATMFHPKYKNGYFSAATALISLNRFPEAAKYLRKMLSFNPGDSKEELELHQGAQVLLQKIDSKNSYYN